MKGRDALEWVFDRADSSQEESGYIAGPANVRKARAYLATLESENAALREECESLRERGLHQGIRAIDAGHALRERCAKLEGVVVAVRSDLESRDANLSFFVGDEVRLALAAVRALEESDEG